MKRIRPSRDRICKNLRSPGIDSASLCSFAGRYDKQMVVVQAHQTGNRFLGPLKGLQIRAQAAKLSCLSRFGLEIQSVTTTFSWHAQLAPHDNVTCRGQPISNLINLFILPKLIIFNVQATKFSFVVEVTFIPIVLSQVRNFLETVAVSKAFNSVSPIF